MGGPPLIVSFYSYKGGVGRSLAVAHVALLLAAALKAEGRGEVLVVDLDLEAPGLDALLAPEASPVGGLALLLREAAAQPDSQRPAWLLKALRGRKFVTKLPGLPLRYLPSGLGRLRAADGPEYPEVAGLLRAGLASQAAGGSALLGDLRAALGAAALYTLVDSRTGLSDESYFSTAILADVLVPLFRVLPTHLDGVQRVVQTFATARGHAPNAPGLPMIPVVSPLPLRGGTDLTERLAEAQARFRRTRLADPSPEARVAAPLATFGKRLLVRLYQEPALELEEALLLDRVGEWIPGFDAEMPLPAGYLGLVRRVRRACVPRDVAAADELIGRWSDQAEDEAAVALLERRIAEAWAPTDEVERFELDEGVLLSRLAPALEARGDERSALALGSLARDVLRNRELDPATLAAVARWAGAGPSALPAAYLGTPVLLVLRARELRARGAPEAALLVRTAREVAARLAPALRAVDAQAHSLCALAAATAAWWEEDYLGATQALPPADEYTERALGTLGASWIALSEPVQALWATDLLQAGLGAAGDGNAAVARACAGWAPDGAPELGELATCLAQPPDPFTAPAPQPTDLLTLLAGGVPAPELDAVFSQDQPVVSAIRQFLGQLRGSPAFDFTLPEPQQDRVVAAWRFAGTWLGGRPNVHYARPPAGPLHLVLLAADLHRLAFYGIATRAPAFRGRCLELLSQVGSVAPGVLHFTLRHETGRPLYLAARHLYTRDQLDAGQIAATREVRDLLLRDGPAPLGRTEADLLRGAAFLTEIGPAFRALVQDLP